RGERVVAEDLRWRLVLDQNVRGSYAGPMMLGGEFMQVSVERRFAAIEAFAIMYPAIQPLNDEHRSAPRQAALHRLLEPRVGRKRLVQRSEEATRLLRRQRDGELGGHHILGLAQHGIAHERGQRHTTQISGTTDASLVGGVQAKVEAGCGSHGGLLCTQYYRTYRQPAKRRRSQASGPVGVAGDGQRV